MFYVTINGQCAMPLRAVPFVTGGQIDAGSISNFTLLSADDPDLPELQLFAYDQTGGYRPIPAVLLLRMHMEIAAARKLGQSPSDLRSFIPPDVFVLEADVRDASRYLFEDLARSQGPEAVFGDPYDAQPPVNNQELAFIVDHVRSLPPSDVSMPAKQTKSSRVKQLQSDAEDLAKILKEGSRRWPSEHSHKS